MSYNLYCKYISEKISLNCADKIGSGVSGDVFELNSDKNIVIKYSNIYINENAEFIIDNLNNVFETLIKDNNFCYAKVFEFSIDFIKKPSNDDDKSFILFQYTIEKLNKISEDELKIFHTLVSHEDGLKYKDYNINYINIILSDLSKYLDFDKDKVLFFVQNYKKSFITHNDVHPRNIMKDNLNNFKLVDFDGCYFS